MSTPPINLEEIRNFAANHDQEFWADDFFILEDDPGELIHVTIRDRSVPIRLKRGLSLGDREAAKQASMTMRITEDGKPEIVKVDDGEFARVLLQRCITSWPFKYRDGSPVPINREMIERMLADGVDTLALRVVEKLQRKQEQQQAFTPPSVRD